MDINLERDGGVIGTLFQQIINDMKNTSPLWEDFMAKANKLHVCLRATIQAISAYLDAFQKIADAATNSRGASKEIGTALTRVCLRHKAVETRMKSFTTAIMDCLILPLQDKVEDWKRQVAVIDKEHSKEYKRCRAELKKRSTDTLRLQKKAKKGQSDSIQSLVESSMHDITQRKADLEEVERRSLRAAMIEERTRFCTFVNYLQPVVKEEFEVMYELGHLQEAMETITNVTKNPNILPQASEELILETKTSASFLYPESPGGSHGYSNSLGSRKSSVCSISSINSSGSSNSPGMQYQRSLSQLMTPAIRLKPGESSDSGFCSSPALTTQASTTTNQTHAVSTWPPHIQDPVTSLDRPHTISTAYEKGHQRPPLTVYTFQNPDGSTASNESAAVQKSPANVACRPPLPVRCSSLERPSPSTAGAKSQTMHNMRQSPSPLPAHITKEYPIIQPTYVNMSELATMAALKITNSINEHYQQQNQEHLTQIQSNTPNIQFSAQSPQSDTSSVTTTNNNLTATTNTNTNNTNTTNSITTNPDSPDMSSTATDDTLSRQASIDAHQISSNDYDEFTSTPEKLSLFEKLEQRQASAVGALNSLSKQNSTTSSGSGNDSPSGIRRNEDISKSMRSIEKDPGQMYEDSIQELNDLIGELDSFQREHELKMKQKEREKQHSKANGKLTDKKMSTSMNDDTSDIYNNFDKLSISSGEPNPMLCSTQTHSSDITFGSDAADLTASLKLNLSTTEHPLVMQSSFTKSIRTNGTNGTSEMNGTSTVKNIQLIPDSYNVSDEYVKENTELVVLRRKGSQSDLSCTTQEPILQNGSISNGKDVERISSFRCSSFSNGKESTLKREPSITSMDHSNNGHEYTNGISVMMQYDENSIDQTDGIDNDTMQMIRHKPIVTPRPASLSGCVNRNTSRRTANVKPPPPVRRSSSVTPSHQLDVSHSPLQPNAMNASSESLPPPPAYLLDSTGRTSPGKVGETVKALTELNHMPASPSVLRRNAAQMNPTPPQSTRQVQSGIYAQPKHVTKVSSFRNASPISARTPPHSNQKIYAQSHQQTHSNSDHSNSHQPPSHHTNQSHIPATTYATHQSRTNDIKIPKRPPNEQIYTRAADRNLHYQQQRMAEQQHYQHGVTASNDGIYNQNHHPNQHYHHSNIQQKIYVSTNPFITTHTSHYSPTSFGEKSSGSYSAPTAASNYSSPTYETSNSIRAKSKLGFLENLNAKLAEQRLSGKAFAVRNIINSKALPDPRVCHESLMDQIKRGATLKRNKSINDRSAPKIY